MKILHRTKGLVHDLIVTRDAGMITLWSGEGVRQTVFDGEAPYIPGLEYARNMLASLALCPQAQSCLVLGLGGGSIPRMLLAARPHLEVEAVEIDPSVVEVAARFFDIRALPRFTVHLEDAAVFLKRCSSRYGVVVVDTYIGATFPDQCANQEFIRNARRCLVDDGVLAINWMDGNLEMRKDLLKSLGSTFGGVWQLPCLKTHNSVYFAAAKNATRHAILSSAAAVEAGVPFENSLKRLTQRLRTIH